MCVRRLLVTATLIALALPAMLCAREARAEGPKYMLLGNGAYLIDGSTRDRFSDMGWGAQLGLKLRNSGMFNVENGSVWLDVIYERQNGSKIEKIGAVIRERIGIGRFLGVNAYAGLGLGVSQTYVSGRPFGGGGGNGGNGDGGNGARGAGREGPPLYGSGGRSSSAVFGSIGLGLLFGSNIVAEFSFNPFDCVNDARLSTINFGLGVAF